MGASPSAFCAPHCSVADLGVRSGVFARRATWRWCLAGGGALCILLGLALGIPNSAAQGGDSSRRHAATRPDAPHAAGGSREASRHISHVTTTTANAATGLPAPLPVGSSDGTSVALAQPASTTLPSPRALGVGVTPATEPLPITTTAALLVAVIGLGAFGAGWSIGRRRALAQG